MIDGDITASLKAAAARSLRRAASSYARPDARRAIFQLLITALPFLALMAGILHALSNGFWVALVLSLPAAALMVRLFMIQHDCGHGSFFASRRANDWLGRAIGLVTLTPYAYWRQNHAVHHATSGNLDRRGVGDITTLTLNEYLMRPALPRLAYRLYRHPLVMFVIGPLYLFLVRHRIPTGSPRRERRAWLSILGTNAMVAAFGAALGWWLGTWTLLLGCVPVIAIAASIGVWLFYVQHQFEDAHWAGNEGWDLHVAAVEGSSYYDLPRPLHWITANIGFHHLHHLCSRIPSYRLRDCFNAIPEAARAKRLTLLSSLKAARLALWDEEKSRLVTFREAHRRRRSLARTMALPEVLPAA